MTAVDEVLQAAGVIAEGATQTIRELKNGRQAEYERAEEFARRLRVILSLLDELDALETSAPIDNQVEKLRATALGQM